MSRKGLGKQQNTRPLFLDALTTLGFQQDAIYEPLFLVPPHAHGVDGVDSIYGTRSIHSAARTIQLRSCDQREQEQGDYDDPRSRISASTKLRLEKLARGIPRYSSKLSSRTSPSRGVSVFFWTLAVGIHFHRSTLLGN
ncbi:hypothetical protein B0H13DRAFT_1915739 [Mycena leptocephala]|nr:hypothetical protein B0H13DRAFT_1915739 [Mycena leptocephala]